MVSVEYYDFFYITIVIEWEVEEAFIVHS